MMDKFYVAVMVTSLVIYLLIIGTHDFIRVVPESDLRTYLKIVDFESTFTPGIRGDLVPDFYTHYEVPVHYTSSNIFNGIIRKIEEY